ncbi:MAG: hypothetical protein WCV59_01275 [Parcubacteria group bacterium]|jgi:hypothetical protein
MKKKNIAIFIIMFLGLIAVSNIITAQAATTTTDTALEQLTGKTSTTSSSSDSTISFSFLNPIGATTVAAVLKSLLTNLQSVVITIAIIFIVIGGLMYMMSGGSEKTITRAKSCVAGAVIGLAIVLAAPIFLNEVIAIFGGSSGIGSTGSSVRLKTVVEKILDLLLSVLGIIAIISLVVGGGMYLTSYGDEDRIKTAKKIVTYAIIGIVISLSALVIVSEVGSILGGTTSSSTSSTSISSLLGF